MNQSQKSLFYTLQSNLQKLSSNFFLGYQPKLFKILQNGTQIGYRNLNQSTFKDQNIFIIKQVTAKQGQDQNVFVLQTPKRNYTIKAKSQKQKNIWIKAIAQLKKQIKKQAQFKLNPKKQPTNTEQTLPSTSHKLNPQTIKKKIPNHQAEQQKKLNNKNQQKLQSPQKTKKRSAHKTNKKKFESPSKTKKKQQIETLENKSQVTKKHERTNSKTSRDTKRKQINYSMPRKITGVAQPPVDSKQILSLLMKFQKSQAFIDLHEQFLIYNIFTIKVDTEVESPSVFNVLNKTETALATYILFSSKSLFPDKCQYQYNLLNNMLPSFCEVDTLYKIVQSIQQTSSMKIKYKMQPVFKMEKVIQIFEKQNDGFLKVNTGQKICVFSFKTIQQKKIFNQILDVARTNQRESTISQKLFRNQTMKDIANTTKKFKRNYDKLITLHQTNKQTFDFELTKILDNYFPLKPTHKFDQFTQTIQNLKVFLIQIIVIFQHKVQPKNHVIETIIHRIHEQVKIKIKLTWDTSQGRVNGLQIQKFLQGIFQYAEAIRQYIKDEEIHDSLKQLSKIYVRQAWKQFQNIIINIVHQQKNTTPNDILKQQQEAPTTHGIVDLLSYIYKVFNIASSLWKHKCHLYNVNRLMLRAFSVYIQQLKAAIDQYVIDNRVQAAIANNYFSITQKIQDFYQQCFTELDKSAKENYNKISVDYRQLSLIIFNNISKQSVQNVRRFFASAQFSNFDLEKLYKIILNDSQSLSNYLHRIFVKKYYEKILDIIKQQVIQALCNEQSKAIQLKKKVTQPNIKPNSIIDPVTPNIKNIKQRVVNIQDDLIFIFKSLTKDKIKNFTEFNQLITILTSTKVQQIFRVLRGLSQPFKKNFKHLLRLRYDFYEGSLLYQKIQSSDLQQDKNPRTNHIINSNKMEVKARKKSEVKDLDYYYDTQSLSGKSDASSARGRSKSIKGELKLISQGYLGKAKLNKTIWQTLYIRMKKGTIYIYADENATASLNSIKIDQIISINIPSAQKSVFIITYQNLNRTKQIHLKADNKQLRQRWYNSIQLQKKRIKNDQQVKRKAQKLNFNGKGKKHKLIIDYQQATLGKGYFSYN